MAAKRKPRVGGNQREAHFQNSSSNIEEIAKRAGKVKDSRPFAAVYTADDSRASNVARVVPETAAIRTVGQAVLGYWHQPNSSHRLPKSWKLVMAKQRYNELARVVKYRHIYALDLGPPIGWAVVLADLEAAFGREVNVGSIDDLCRRLRLPLIDPDIVAGVAHTAERARRVWTDYRPINAASVGSLIALTSLERDECKIRRIDAADESSAERNRRLSRERMRRKRFREMLRAH